MWAGIGAIRRARNELFPIEEARKYREKREESGKKREVAAVNEVHKWRFLFRPPFKATILPVSECFYLQRKHIKGTEQKALNTKDECKKAGIFGQRGERTLPQVGDIVKGN